MRFSTRSRPISALLPDAVPAGQTSHRPPQLDSSRRGPDTLPPLLARRQNRRTSLGSWTGNREERCLCCSRSSLERVLSVSCLPIADGNTRPAPSLNSRASASTPSALSDKGTRCSFPAFMRSAGTVHVAPSRSTSHRLAPRTSPERQAVNATDSRASLVEAPSIRVADGLQGPGNVAMGQRPLVFAVRRAWVGRPR